MAKQIHFRLGVTPSVCGRQPNQHEAAVPVWLLAGDLIDGMFVAVTRTNFSRDLR